MNMKSTVSIVLTTIVLTAIVTYVFATSSTIPFTISGGNYPGAPSYTVWCEGSDYFAKNASGVIEFSGTNAATVAQQAIDTTDTGRVILKGEIYVNSPINITAKENFWFEFEVLSFGNNGQLVVENCSGWNPVTVMGNRIKISQTGYTLDALDIIDSRYVRVQINSIRKDIVDINGTAVEIKSVDGSRGCMANHIYIGGISGFTDGILLYTENDGWINANTIIVDHLESKRFGVRILNHGTGQIANNVFDVRATIYSPVDPHPASYGIHLSGDSTGEITYTVFMNYQAWDVPSDGNCYVYYANEKVISTTFIGGMPRREVDSFWLDGGNLTEFVSIAVPWTTTYSIFADRKSGTATVSNGDYFTHGLAGKPTTVTLTCMNATYDGVPVVVNCNYANTNSTHVCVSMYWTNGTAITTDLLVSYYVEYKP